jgi:hypothetical protein
VELTCHADVVDCERVKRFWDLTCIFWAENAKRKTMTPAKSIRSVASPCGVLAKTEKGKIALPWLDGAPFFKKEN